MGSFFFHCLPLRNSDSGQIHIGGLQSWFRHGAARISVLVAIVGSSNFFRVDAAALSVLDLFTAERRVHLCCVNGRGSCKSPPFALRLTRNTARVRSARALVAGGGSMDRAAVWCVNFRMLQVSDDQTVYTKNGRNGILIPRPSVVHFGVRKWLVTMRKLTYDHT